MSRKQYAEIVLSVVPRMLSALDRNEVSDTFGCFDKNYWFYKTSDFPCARLQEPMLTLALLHQNRFEKNVYFKNPKVKQWAEAGLEFLSRIQNKDGSFNEWYPNERSFCATAFCTYSASESFKLLKNEIKQCDEIIGMLERAGSWLISRNEEVCNQQAGAIVALYNIYKITSGEKYRRGAKDKLQLLENMQSVEGWFPEYGGADPGYLTVTIDFLGKYFKVSKDNKTLDITRPALKFLKYFLHPDGTIGGVYGSRNAEIRLPHGLEIFSVLNEDAKYLANGIANNVKNTLNPARMDDRYAFIYHISYLQAFLEPITNYNSPLSTLKEENLFDESGLYVRNRGYYMVTNLKRGGVFKLYGDECIFNDCGIIAKIGKKIFTTNWNGSSTFKKKGNEIVVDGCFKECVSTKRLSPTKNILMRSFLISLGKSPKISSFLKKHLRKKLILEAKDSKLSYKRHFLLEPTKVSVLDEVSFPENLKVDAFYFSLQCSSSYCPTSAFFDQYSLITRGVGDAQDLRKGPVRREFKIK